MSKLIPLSQTEIENRIFTIRGIQIMIDRDLAELYQVETKVLNQAVKRNIERFPEAFRFQLDDDEKNELVTNCDRFELLKYSTVNPYAFTEQGVAMLSAVLRSNIAVQVSIQIMEAFVQMRKFIGENALQQLRLLSIENKLIEHDQKFEQIFQALEQNELPSKGIFYNGQVFDAYVFVSQLIKKANKSLILIDNYIDETVLALLNKRKKGVHACIYTKKISRTLQLDLEKHNSQYPPVEVKTIDVAHDRFLIIDNKELYHMGASLKDLGKRWFAFSKMDKEVLNLLNRLKTDLK